MSWAMYASLCVTKSSTYTQFMSTKATIPPVIQPTDLLDFVDSRATLELLRGQVFMRFGEIFSKCVQIIAQSNHLVGSNLSSTVSHFR